MSDVEQQSENFEFVVAFADERDRKITTNGRSWYADREGEGKYSYRPRDIAAHIPAVELERFREWLHGMATISLEGQMADIARLTVAISGGNVEHAGIVLRTIAGRMSDALLARETLLEVEEDVVDAEIAES